MEYSIGDLSKISRVSGKKLHQYHISGLVVPTRIDKFDSNFRYYDDKCLHQVETVTRFLNMGFSEEAIMKILPKNRDTKHLIEQMRSRRIKNDPHWEELGLTRDKIEIFLQAESTTSVSIGALQVKTIPDVFVAYDRFRGKSKEIKEHQNNLMEICGQAADKPYFTLFLDYNQFDEEMNVECCVPVTEEIPVSGLGFRTLPGEKAVTIVYEGSYDKIWIGYKQIVDFYIMNDMNVQFPSREVHLIRNENPLPGVNECSKVEIQFNIGKINEPDHNWKIPKPRY